MYDVLAPPPRVLTVVAFDRLCPAHAADVPKTEMLWQDGNWKDKDAYLDYQRKWFRRLNYTEWLVNHPGIPMPDAIKDSTTDPITSGSQPAPPQVEIDGMNQAYRQNREHNLWKNVAMQAITDEGIDRKEITWFWTGVGDARILTMVVPGLTPTQLNNALAKVDIQFGPGKIVIS